MAKQWLGFSFGLSFLFRYFSCDNLSDDSYYIVTNLETYHLQCNHENFFEKDVTTWCKQGHRVMELIRVTEVQVWLMLFPDVFPC